MTWLLFIAGFMFLAAVLLLGLIYGRLHWGLKASLIVMSLLFCGLFYSGLIDSLGYPAPAQPPAVFEFLSAAIREPTRDSQGAVYIWLLSPGNDLPRAIEVPYSSENRRAVARAKERLQGGRVFMSLHPASPSSHGSQGGGGANASGKGHGKSGDKLYDVHGTPTLEITTPPDTLPRKEGQ
jgi:hypothetical protein